MSQRFGDRSRAIEPPCKGITHRGFGFGEHLSIDRFGFESFDLGQDRVPHDVCLVRFRDAHDDLKQWGISLIHRATGQQVDYLVVQIQPPEQRRVL